MKDVTTINVPESRFTALESKISHVLELLSQKKSEVKNYTPKEFCKLVNISLPTFNRLKRDGKIGFIKVGKKTLINASEVENFVKNGVK